MGFSKVHTLINQVTAILEKNDRDFIKMMIGDSTDNNRTISVSQLLRFLRLTRNSKNRQLANEIEVVFQFEEIRYDLYHQRINRKDAYDVSEFLAILEINTRDTTAVRALNKVLSKAA